MARPSRSIASRASFASVLSINSTGSILGIANVGSMFSVASFFSALSIGGGFAFLFIRGRRIGGGEEAMTEQNQFEAFMQGVLQRPLPTNQMARIRILAKELAEGATENLWKPDFRYYEFQEPELRPSADPNDNEEPHYSYKRTNVTNYIEQRWGFDNIPNLELLVVNEFLKKVSYTSSIGFPYDTLALTRSALELLQEVETTTIFVSYKRSESSAFALLVNTRLKLEGLNSYLDMAIPAGDDWQKRIKEEIGNHDYFVFLLNKQMYVVETFETRTGVG